MEEVTQVRNKLYDKVCGNVQDVLSIRDRLLANELELDEKLATRVEEYRAALTNLEKNLRKTIGDKTADELKKATQEVETLLSSQTKLQAMTLDKRSKPSEIMQTAPQMLNTLQEMEDSNRNWTYHWDLPVLCEDGISILERLQTDKFFTSVGVCKGVMVSQATNTVCPQSDSFSSDGASCAFSKTNDDKDLSTRDRNTRDNEETPTHSCENTSQLPYINGHSFNANATPLSVLFESMVGQLSNFQSAPRELSPQMDVGCLLHSLSDNSTPPEQITPAVRSMSSSAAAYSPSNALHTEAATPPNISAWPPLKPTTRLFDLPPATPGTPSVALLATPRSYASLAADLKSGNSSIFLSPSARSHLHPRHEQNACPEKITELNQDKHIVSVYYYSLNGREIVSIFTKNNTFEAFPLTKGSTVCVQSVHIPDASRITVNPNGRLLLLTKDESEISLHDFPPNVELCQFRHKCRSSRAFHLASTKNFYLYTYNKANVVHVVCMCLTKFGATLQWDVATGISHHRAVNAMESDNGNVCVLVSRHLTLDRQETQPHSTALVAVNKSGPKWEVSFKNLDGSAKFFDLTSIDNDGQNFYVLNLQAKCVYIVCAATGLVLGKLLRDLYKPYSLAVNKHTHRIAIAHGYTRVAIYSYQLNTPT